MRLAYYGRCMSIYGTKAEDNDIKSIEKLGYKVIGFPAQHLLNERKAKGENVMETIFKPLVESADILFFRSLPNGKISAGVGQEALWAKAKGITVLEIPQGVYRRTISIEATREYLRDVGQR